MTTIVPATGPDRFLALIPGLLGFTPRRSIVLVPFAGSRSRGALRADAPRAGAELAPIAATLIGLVCRVADADGYAVVVYDDGPRPHADLVAALAVCAEACGLRTVDALWTGAGRWGSYRADGRGGPAPVEGALPGGTPRPPAGDQFSGADLPSADPDEIALMAEQVARLDAAAGLLAGVRGAGRVDPAALTAAGDLDDLPQFFDTALAAHGSAADAAAPFRSALLVWCLARPALRDVALATWAGGVRAGDAALHAQLRWERGEEYPPALAERMWGEGPRPDPRRLGAALAVCRSVAATAPREHAAGTLAACAWLSWALGRSTHADVYARSACEIEPEHGLASIVLSFVAAAHLPGWAFTAG